MTTTETVEFLQRYSGLKDGDLIYIRMSEGATDADSKALEESIAETFADGPALKVLLLPAGTSLHHVAEEDLAEVGLKAL